MAFWIVPLKGVYSSESVVGGKRKEQERYKDFLRDVLGKNWPHLPFWGFTISALIPRGKDNPSVSDYTGKISI